MNEFVWIVEQGYECEDNYIVGVYTNKDSALKYAKRLIEDHSGDDWILEFETECHMGWSCGIAYITVKQYVVGD